MFKALTLGALVGLAAAVSTHTKLTLQFTDLVSSEILTPVSVHVCSPETFTPAR